MNERQLSARVMDGDEGGSVPPAIRQASLYLRLTSKMRSQSPCS